MNPEFDEENGILKRVSIKLSTDLSNEEIRQAIANAMGISLNQIPQVDFPAAKSKIKEEISKVEEIISEYKNKLQNTPGITQDKFDELSDIGRFIVASNERLKIIIPEKISVFPDFTVKMEERIIGIEHTRLMNEEIKATIKTVKYFIEKANKIIAEDLNHLSKTANIFIDYNAIIVDQKTFKSRKFTSSEKDGIIMTIADYIRKLLIEGNDSKPSFITHITISSNKDSRVDLELAESYFTQNEFTDLLIERINSKELKVDSYKREACINEIWLLIVADDINSYSGYDTERALFPQIDSSKFDKLILFEKFSGKIHFLYGSSISP
jgi:hypothetical protein